MFFGFKARIRVVGIRRWRDECSRSLAKLEKVVYGAAIDVKSDG